MNYEDFLRQKIKMASFKGFDVPMEQINPGLKPHTRDIVRWAVQGGNRAVFASFGLHKTATQLEVMRQIGIHRPGLRLQVAPLGVRQEFKAEIEQRFQGEYAIDMRFIRRDSEIDDPATLYLTNYESVREGNIDVSKFRATSLDEASVLRSYGSKTYQEFLPAFAPVEFKFVATATPSPNRYKELIHYAGYLGVMDTGQALTRFFQRDSEKAGNLTLYPHKTEEFWMWVASWAVFIQRPSDLCGCLCHKEKTSLDSDLATSLPVNGLQVQSATVHGDVSAIAGGAMSPVATTSREAGSSVAVACAPSTAEKALAPTQSGAESLSDALATHTKTGQTMAAVESQSANAGESSPISSPIWDSRQMAAPSNEETTTETTSQTTANGQPEKSKPETLGAASSSNSTDVASHLLHGQKNSESTTGSSTAVSRWAGRRIGCSKTYCEECVSLDDGYVLPELDVRYHEVPSDYAASGTEKNGQGLLIPDVAMGLSAAAAEKRNSMDARVAVVADLVAQDPADHFIVWHDLEDERHAIQKAIPDAVSVWGSQDLDQREDLIVDFSNGQHRVLSTKPIIAGSGCNFQRHCHREIFAGIGFKFNDFIQAIHRVHRFGQSKRVRIDIVHTESEREVLKTLQIKWQQHIEMGEKMTEIIRSYGLNQLAMQEVLARSIGVKRIEVKGERFSVANNDCVEEAKLQPESSVDLIVTSIPFANHYEYTPSYNDFGHTQDNAHFWAQMDFLTPELLRILKPGRIYACHVKDRINFGNVTGAGIPTVSPFHAEALFHGIKHGFDYMGMITVVTDVVRENNQTYRLGYTEMCKDGSKMGVGSPEYVLLFHKPQTDRGRGYADQPIKKDKADYSLAKWQVDAHAFWRSSGNRLLTAEEMASYGPGKLAKMFTDYSLANVYDYDFHVKIGEELLERQALPSTFMSLAPGSHHPDVWHDINRMRTLNGDQTNRAVEKHVCLARGTLVLTRERGYVPIETVEVGEQVLTHRGRWRRVLVARNTGVRPTITVRAQGVPGLTLTPDHKLWARTTDWVRERDGAERAEPKWIEAQHTLGGYLNFKLPPVEQANGSDHVWWIVGRWLADGHYGARGEVVISCGFHEVDDLIASLGERAGTVHRTGTAAQIRVRDRDGAIRDALSGCGEGAAGKRMPPLAMDMGQSAAHALLTGYLSGDGHFLAERGRWIASTVSKALALGVAALAQRVFGSIASIHEGRPERESEIQGRRVQCRQEWGVSFDSTTDGRKKPFVLDDGAWKKVRALEDAGEAEVWCLRVEEDESFTAEGCIVKNCPLQFDIVDRLIERYSSKGERVYDPFCGLGTVPVRAIKLGRTGGGSELSASYFMDQVHYLKAAEREFSMPGLFEFEDAVELQAA